MDAYVAGDVFVIAGELSAQTSSPATVACTARYSNTSKNKSCCSIPGFNGVFIARAELRNIVLICVFVHTQSEVLRCARVRPAVRRICEFVELEKVANRESRPLIIEVGAACDTIVS